MLKSHREAIPPQRWTGWGYESDPEVWTPELLKGDTQYWFGDAMLVAGIYEPGVSTARVYLPGRAGDLGFLNVNAPHQHLAARKWHEISSPYEKSIPILARIGSAIPVGKSTPTTCFAEEDAEFPEMDKDDWRAVEIFPPPVTLADGTDTTGTEFETKWYQNSWLEDDGISSAEKADAFLSTISYAAATGIKIKIELKKEGKFEPLWVKNGLNVVLPVGEERRVTLESDSGEVAANIGRDNQGRQVWQLGVHVSK